MNKQKNKKYFNSLQTNRISRLINNYPHEAINEAEYYLVDYPYDVMAHHVIASSLINLGRFLEAEEVIKEAYLIMDKKIKDPKRKTFVEKMLLELELRLDIAFDEYIDGLIDLKKVKKSFPEDEGKTRTFFLARIEDYLNYKLGTPTKNKTYFNSQLNNYSYNRFLDATKSESFIPTSKFGREAFFKELDFEHIFSKINRFIQFAKKYYMDATTDTCYFKIDNIGQGNKKLIYDYVEIYVIHNTNNMIIAKPIADIGEHDFIDLSYVNHLEDNIDDSKIKRLSRIEKFNKKYKKLG